MAGGGESSRKLIKVALVVFLSVLLSQLSVMATNIQADEEGTSFERIKFRDALNSIVEYDTVKPTKVPVYAKSYLLFDTKTAQVVVGKNYSTLVPIASTTKMTTALVASKLLKSDDVATISTFPTRVAGSKIDLRAGEKITVGSLLKGLLIYSGNDTAFALAEQYSGEIGNYQKFVTEMNKFVTDNHLKNTTYGDPAGLDDEVGRSTAFDLAQIARLLLNDPGLAEIVATPQTSVTSSNGLLVHQLKNTNRLIQPDSSYYMPDVVGVKTGFTLDAGHCLVAARKYSDRYLIGVVLNTDQSTNEASAAEMKKLFTWADSNWQVIKYE